MALWRLSRDTLRPLRELLFCGAVLSFVGLPLSAATPAGGVGSSHPEPEAESAQVLQAQPFPQPNPISLRVQLSKRTAGLSVSIYSRGQRLVATNSIGAAGPGWVDLPLPAEVQTLPNDIYYFRIHAGGGKPSDYLGRFLRLR